MMDKIKVSIIVPVFNAGPYLQKVAQSVFDQSFTDYELIFVNDGSTDNSLSILNELAQQDSRVMVFDQENKGATAARKMGWLRASAEYITFLDADDVFLEGGLLALMQECGNGDYDIVNGSFISVPNKRVWQIHTVEELGKTEYLDALMTGKNFGVMYASVYKKALFQESSFAFDKTIKVGEDVLMNLELCKRVDKVKNVKDIVYQYTEDTAGSVTSVIVRHPSYYIRFNKIRDSLIKALDPVYYTTTKEQQEKKDNNEIINSFFSPFIEFDKVYYTKVKPLKNKVVKKNIYVYCLSNIWLTKITKVLLSLLFAVKNGVNGRSSENRKILF
ncbi:glycosyltransferase family 2 protein [Maribacter luteus]|uniref:Glycosyltransferase n=1 Tax=Maribacter luteus TaxID=2594478 RepID=A0A6I2MQ53_9FLAO|nr:glycosyltransferase [Maribacter luteus]MRX63336.1 glycosyltransferase [Maribacter luteus]